MDDRATFMYVNYFYIYMMYKEIEGKGMRNLRGEEKSLRGQRRGGKVELESQSVKAC